MTGHFYWNILWIFSYIENSGIWNVPYIASVYLVQGHRMLSLEDAYLDEDEDVDADMAFCKKDTNVW